MKCNYSKEREYFFFFFFRQYDKVTEEVILEF